MSISAFIPVFNEEKRIRYALTSLKWCDEIILLDKNSTDKTVEIAKELGAKVYSMENTVGYNADVLTFFKYCSSAWIILFTASDIIDIELASEIKRITSIPNFEFDILNVPYKRYILGIENKRSPWHGDFHKSVFKKAVLNIRTEEVHSAIGFTSNKKLDIVNVGNSAIHHLTHETVDSMMDRHLRYWRTEGEMYSDLTLKKALKGLLRAIKVVMVNKKTILMGWNGVALICAYLSYAMMSFVYKWEKINSNASEYYKDLREKSIENWKELEKHNEQKNKK